jgi:ribosome biogenesis GTPase / thiamine phosphate phosphatase
MNYLSKYGWTSLQQEFISSSRTELLPGRVISIKGYKYYLITNKGELETELSGKLLFESDGENLPKVGDWTLFIDYETTGYIVEVMPRLNSLSRKSPGKKVTRQVLAANIDCGVIVQGLDRDFNLMRLDRYIVQIIACGIKPAVILNKADLVEDPEQFVNDVLRLKRDCQVFVCSTLTGMGLDELIHLFEAAKTFILIGSSGVGKSSLLNVLMGNMAQRTGMVSDVNHKGKHTTTTRDLFSMPNGALLIDTPGMREFGVTSESGSSDETMFPAIQELAEKCRYADCKHINENGCAVIDALRDQTLDPLIYDSYTKLIKEQRRFQISADEKKQQAKMFGRLTKEAKSHRKKYKY